MLCCSLSGYVSGDPARNQQKASECYDEAKRNVKRRGGKYLYRDFNGRRTISEYKRKKKDNDFREDVKRFRKDEEKL